MDTWANDMARDMDKAAATSVSGKLAQRGSCNNRASRTASGRVVAVVVQLEHLFLYYNAHKVLIVLF